MRNEFLKIQQSIDTYQALQAEQISSFDVGRDLPDLMSQSHEREVLTSKLMRRIGFFMKMVNKQRPPNSEVMLIQLNEGLVDILAQNQILEKKIKQLRDSIEKRMTQVSKGRQVMGGYRSSVAGYKTPRVISITN